ncbi:kremen protein 1 isoform X1 [Tachysurus ichikawai]
MFQLSAVTSCTVKECYTVNGEDYRGKQNQTSLHGGKPCLFWNETFQHPYNTLKYPNGEGGLGAHNFCRCWILKVYHKLYDSAESKSGC